MGWALVGGCVDGLVGDAFGYAFKYGFKYMVAARKTGRAIDAVLDSTGKVHGRLPVPQDLGRYDVDELGVLRDGLKKSVQSRIEATVQMGADYGHNDRLAA